uniref:Uncharacterized protein AlNc14C18G1890 n=1 Tax=Albugo laibachii Nc14 TaxID=890382 RepID=F0W4R9_9STRA|nr:conserved hypothetical protein [Albugo laibachii Nc14]|eukprot:CCA16104.1 conserved hypothetical protein [Albugo laibachii Nc14]
MWTHVRSIALRRVNKRSIALSSSRQLVCHLGNTLTAKTPAFISYPLSNPRFFTSLHTESEHPSDNANPSDLNLEWKTIRVQLIDDPNNSENAAKLKEIITRADRNYDTPFLKKVFKHLQKFAPQEITFETYGLMFRIWNRMGDGDSMIATYETGIQYYGNTENPSIPELIYRFGVAGYLYQGEFDKADEILNTMDENQIQISDELHSIIMMTHAKAGNKDRVISSYHALNPEKGWWYQNVFDRVITSLGIIGEPQLAFDFYTKSRKSLHSGTLRSLLQVCINNNCPEQAAKILENRKHFDLKLNTNAYNSILLALEFLNRQDELESVLEEMKETVRLDSLTHKIIRRNESVLNEEILALAQDTRRSQYSTPEPDNTILRLIHTEKYAEAVQAAEPLMEEAKMEHFKDPSNFVENAIYIHPQKAKTVLKALAHAKETEKLARFLTHCNQYDASYRFALRSLAKFYRDQSPAGPNHTNYLVYRRLQDTDTVIYDTKAASDAFAAFNDVDALAQLYERILAVRKQWDDHAITENSEVENPVRERPLGWANFRVALKAYSTMLISNNRLDEFSSAMDQAIDAGFDLRNNFYIDLNYELKALGQRILTEKKSDTTSKKSKPLLAIPRAAELLFTDMKKRGLPANSKVLTSALETLSFGDEYQIKLLLELYQQTQADGVVFPLYACCRLLSAIFTHGTVEMSTQLFQDIKSEYVPSPETFMTKLKDKHGQVTERQIKLLAQCYYWHILKLAATKELDQAFDTLQELTQLNLEIKYMPVVRVWNLALQLRDEEKADALSQLFESNNFRMNVYDACQFARHIHANNDLERGLKMLDHFERANIEVKETTEANESQDDTVMPKVSVRPKNIDGGPQQWNWRQTKEALSVYENVLELAQERGDAELVSHLQSRIEMLFPSVLRPET